MSKKSKLVVPGTFLGYHLLGTRIHIGVALGFLKKSQNKLTFDFEKKSKYVDF